MDDRDKLELCRRSVGPWYVAAFYLCTSCIFFLDNMLDLPRRRGLLLNTVCYFDTRLAKLSGSHSLKTTVALQMVLMRDLRTLVLPTTSGILRYKCCGFTSLCFFYCKKIPGVFKLSLIDENRSSES